MLGLPIVYVVVVGVKLLVLALGLADLSTRGILLSSLLSALAGTRITVGLSLVGAFKRAMEPSASRRSADPEASFLAGLSIRMPLALLIAGLMDLPDTPAARVVTGTAWGCRRRSLRSRLHRARGPGADPARMVPHRRGAGHPAGLRPVRRHSGPR
ncbi:hypothetical protein JOD64_005566 [Micromonospora luteifusca]|uniref:Cation/H+ exchanger domain-containing protein n=1 Tax=Micromonospora luteifusca TaxID=709860 RepID=A0ABS2M373_9ACTN|nr:hypothetical protein [Micromonospora luteifusca]